MKPPLGVVFHWNHPIETTISQFLVSSPPKERGIPKRKYSLNA